MININEEEKNRRKCIIFSENINAESKEHIMTFEEQKELTYQNYQRSWDLSIAIKLLGLSEKENEKLLNDENLLYRINLYDANIQENLIANLRGFAESDNEGIAIKATLELGRMFYKKRFIVDNKNNNDNNSIPIMPDKIVLVGGKD